MSDIRETPDHRLDYDLAATVRADTPAQLKALADPTRVTILDLVLERAATTTELAEALGKPKGTVDHHVKVLERAGLLRVVRTRKVRAMTERFWGRTARSIMINDDVDGAEDDEPGAGYFVRRALEEIRSTPDAYRALDVGMSTLRHARIPAERLQDYVQRLEALTLAFSSEPRGGDVVYGMLVTVFATDRPGLKEPS